jgi:hypothetical protein
MCLSGARYCRPTVGSGHGGCQITTRQVVTGQDGASQSDFLSLDSFAARSEVGVDVPFVSSTRKRSFRWSNLWVRGIVTDHHEVDVFGRPKPSRFRHLMHETAVQRRSVGYQTCTVTDLALQR